MDVALGFIGGAVIALAGSIGVARYDRTRRHRVRLLLELLPELLNAIRGLRYSTPRGWEGPPVADTLAADVEREATVASHADRKRAKRILRFVEAAGEARRGISGQQSYEALPDVRERETFEVLNGQAEAAVVDYQRWLASRFSLRARARWSRHA